MKTGLVRLRPVGLVLGGVVSVMAETVTQVKNPDPGDCPGSNTFDLSLQSISLDNTCTKNNALGFKCKTGFFREGDEVWGNSS